ncbi:MAG: DUF3866 domain-containing protein, partial [Bacillota bacterium]
RIFPLPSGARHGLVEVDAGPAAALLEEAGIPRESMGRRAAEDPILFLAAAAAGVLAGRLARTAAA